MFGARVSLPQAVREAALRQTVHCDDAKFLHAIKNLQAAHSRPRRRPCAFSRIASKTGTRLPGGAVDDLQDLRRRRLLLAGLAEFGGQCRDPSLELRIGGRRPAGLEFSLTAAPEWRLIGERLSLATGFPLWQAVS